VISQVALIHIATGLRSECEMPAPFAPPPICLFPSLQI
jgi:hypothetical protein